MSPKTELLTRQLAEKLIRLQMMICTAESCTGGLIAKTFTDLAGSSEWFERGFVTYSNQAKMDMLGVSQLTLQQQGAVSEATAAEMAKGALEHSLAQYAIVVTGIAGPTGGSAEKPVGTVWFGFATPTQLVCERQLFQGDRQQVRQQTLDYALQRMLELIQ